jgi:hypothetical protein
MPTGGFYVRLYSVFVHLYGTNHASCLALISPYHLLALHHSLLFDSLGFSRPVTIST